MACVLNGEIYNYLDLRKELRELGFYFGTNCDTEVALKAFMAWGVCAFSRFNGMFAMAVADVSRRSFILARDYFGIKPLYIGRHELGWLFSSELKGATSSNVLQVEVCEPGTYVCLTQEGLGTYTRYLCLDEEVGDERADSLALAEALEQSVRDHVQTDLPVAVFFGGGVDSAAVLALAKKHHPGVVAITLGTPDSPDAEHAARFCRDFAIDNLVVSINELELADLAAEIVETAEGFHRNLIRGSQLTYLMCREACRRGYKIVLCGEGSDELFCGYADFALTSSVEEAERLRRLFLADLHRTQLQRVDRCGMRFSLEVRVPFLDRRVASIALRTSPSELIGEREGVPVTKLLLRESVADLLPGYISWRPKMTLMRGAGIVDASAARWPIEQFKPIKRFLEAVPSWITEEERGYLEIFSSRFPLLAQDFIRPTVTVAPEEILCR
jgi:asparagine synthase (glutamine-hydrolysing)